MNEHDAFEEEMLFRRLSDEEVEGLLQGRAPEGSRLADLAEFARALRQTLPARPVSDGSNLVAQLAETARSMSLADEGRTPPIATAIRSRPRGSRLMPARLAAVAKATVVLALVPMLFAGLAFGGVTLPEPAREAFETVGVDLPNQPVDEGKGSQRDGGSAGKTGEESENDVSAVPEEKTQNRRARGVEAGRPKHGTAKSNPATAGGRANGRQGQGRALGKRGLAPGQLRPPGRVQPPGQLKQGGGDKAVGKTNAAAPGQSSNPGPRPGKGKANAAPPGPSSKPRIRVGKGKAASSGPAGGKKAAKGGKAAKG